MKIDQDVRNISIECWVLYWQLVSIFSVLYDMKQVQASFTVLSFP